MTWQTHDVFNQFDELSDYNLFATDAALTEAVRGADAAWAGPRSRAMERRSAAPSASARPTKPIAMRPSCRPSTAGAGASTRWTSIPPGMR